MSAAPSEADIAFAKSSFRFKNVEEVLGSAQMVAARQELLADFARNAKKSESKATSGVTLPYVLGLSASFMDPVCSRKIVDATVQCITYIRDKVLVPKTPDEKILIVGMEVAGGIMVSQLAACCGATLGKNFEFVYMRKEKKKSGAGQQLEGVASITDRTAASTPALRAIWVDDANSTGSSLTAGIDVLAKDYNISVEAAFYVCDRSADRANLPLEKMYFARDVYTSKKTQVFALCDLQEVDVEVAKLQK